jgi:hypothetical protein
VCAVIILFWLSLSSPADLKGGKDSRATLSGADRFQTGAFLAQESCTTTLEPATLQAVGTSEESHRMRWNSSTVRLRFGRNPNASCMPTRCREMKARAHPAEFHCVTHRRSHSLSYSPFIPDFVSITGSMHWHWQTADGETCH